MSPHHFTFGVGAVKPIRELWRGLVLASQIPCAVLVTDLQALSSYRVSDVVHAHRPAGLDAIGMDAR